MVYLGSMFQTFSLITALLAFFSSIAGVIKKSNKLILLARQAVFLHLIVLLGTAASLWILLLSADFSVEYVVKNVSLSLPFFYRFTAIWAGQAGSMLFWNLLLAAFSALAIVQAEKIKAALVPHMIYILMSVSLLFVLMANFSADTDAFRLIHQNWQPAYQPDGRGLNPLLQHWAMVIHPPILYLGFTGFAIPFAIGMAALITRQQDGAWMRLIRRWNLFAWLFLGMGIILGALWAYEELGWGGYWGWDPVENASLMPWIVGTAVLHSMMAQERRGIFKLWNMVLLSLAFLMSIFATFITRSGLVTSVHAFPSSGLGSYFLVYMALIVLFSAFWIIRYRSFLKPQHQIEKIFSREFAFLFNNIFLLIILFTVIVGTLYPTFSELMGAETTMTIGPDWYNRWVAPMGIVLLFITGLAPMLTWGGVNSDKEKKALANNLLLPTGFALLTFAVYLAWRFWSLQNNPQHGGGIVFADLKWLAGVSFATSIFLIVAVLRDFVRGTRSRVALSRENPLAAFLSLMLQNKRRYMGYSIHISLAILFFGFTGSAFDQKTQISLRPLEAVEFNGYLIKLEHVEQVRVPEREDIAPLYIADQTFFKIFRKNRFWDAGVSEIRHYPIYNTQTGRYEDQQPSSEPAIFRGWNQDLYIQFAGMEKNGRAVMSVYVNPLMSVIWLGFFVNTLFLVLLLLPIGEDGRLRVGNTSFVLIPGLRNLSET